MPTVRDVLVEPPDPLEGMDAHTEVTVLLEGNQLPVTLAFPVGVLGRALPHLEDARDVDEEIIDQANAEAWRDLRREALR